jgi:hypothetical protein
MRTVLVCYVSCASSKLLPRLGKVVDVKKLKNIGARLGQFRRQHPFEDAGGIRAGGFDVNSD